MSEQPLAAAQAAPSGASVSDDMRVILGALSGGIAVFDGLGQGRYHNHTWLHYGLPVDLGTSAADSNAAASAGVLSTLLSRVLAGASEVVELLDYGITDRASAAYELRASLLRQASRSATDGSGPAEGSGDSRWVLLQALDISKHVRAERGQREADSLLMAILDTADVGLCLIDQRGRFSTVNRAYCTLFGYQVEELVGRLHTRVLLSEEHEHARRLFERLIAGQGSAASELGGEAASDNILDIAARPEGGNRSVRQVPLSSELRGRRKDGSQIDLYMSARLLIRGDGRRFLVCSVLDITERKEKSRELEERAHVARSEAAHKSQLLSELDHKLALIEEQHRQIVELSAPVLDLWDGILVLPIIGALTAERASTVTERLLSAVVARRARAVILDLTSARDFAGGSLDYLVRMVRAVRLLGARAVLTGLTPAAARELVGRGLTITDIPALRSLAEGLRVCIGNKLPKSGRGPG